MIRPFSSYRGSLGAADATPVTASKHVTATTRTATRPTRSLILLPAEGPELVAEEAERRHQHDRDRLRRDLRQADGNEKREDGEVRPQRSEDTARKRTPWVAMGPRARLNVQSRFHE